jgi:glucose/arabinose dehydrogenase
VRVGVVAVSLAVASLAAACVPPPTPEGGTFAEEVVFSGLENPTAVRFAKDGRVFVAEKSGLVKVFDDLSDPSAAVFADLRTQVHNFYDRGLLGLAIHPQFPAQPYVYVAYTHDAVIGGTAPRWGSPGATNDPCPTPPGPSENGCVVSGRISRLRANGNQMTGAEQVLVEGWCTQFQSHSLGTLAFGPDGMLYASGGEGAGYTTSIDYGQSGQPRNPCGDPPGGVGAVLSPPSAQGGSLRSQDLRTPADPTGLSGTVIRIDPTTGAAAAGNPLASSPDPNARRVIAYGLRNPYRFAFRPGTNEVYIGDVGWQDWEELDRIANARDATVENFGWPCYEGAARQPGWDAADLTMCENLYASPAAVTMPISTYHHLHFIDDDEGCERGGSITGLAFVPAANVAYPGRFRNALFYTDYSRGCIWVLPPGGDGRPDPARRQFFVLAANPVDLQIGPDGNLFYANIAGDIRRVRYSLGNRAPSAVVTADPRYGTLPLDVALDASGSSDIEGDDLTFAWDLDNDGAFDDSTALRPTVRYTTAGNKVVRVRVTDTFGMAATASVTISAGNRPPTAVIDTPPAGTTFSVGERITFSGHATDPDGALPASALSWSTVMHHCTTETTCHEHQMETIDGATGGDLVGPDHDYPAYIELRLTVTDDFGLRDTASLELQPETAALSMQSSPPGLDLTTGSQNQATPFVRTVIRGATVTVSAPTPQTLGGTTYDFVSWSDGGARTHDVKVSASGSLVATYQAR